MKNHKLVDGKLLQTNKKWSHLKQSQKTWIYEITKEEHAAFVAKQNQLPRKKYKEEVIDRVFDKINGREIWIPYYEAKTNISKFIDRQNRKSPLNNYQPSEKELAKRTKPKPPQAPFEEFPADVQADIKNFLANGIERYIEQTFRLPPNRIRDDEIKTILKGFNSKKYKPHGKKMQCSEALLTFYDETRKEIFAKYDNASILPNKISKPKRDRLKEQTIILETERLILRKMNGRDYKDIKIMLADPDVMYAWERVFTTKREVMEWIIRQLKRYQRELVGYFAAIDKVSGQIVGQIGLMWNDIQGKRCLEVGYILKKEYWHKGYAAEGAKACLNFGFELFGVDKIYATIRPENKASVAVAERLGMTIEGEYTKKYDGKQMKHVIYAMKNPCIVVGNDE